MEPSDFLRSVANVTDRLSNAPIRCYLTLPWLQAICVFVLLLASDTHLSSAAEPDEEGLVAYWSFDGTDGARVEDVSGKGHHGTILGKAKQKEGVRGKSLCLDGSRDYVSVPDDGTLDFSDATFSVTAWVNVYALPSEQQMIVGKNVYSANQREWGLMLDRDNRFRFYLRHDGQWKTVESRVIPVPGRWYHITVTVQAGQASLYLNGAQEGQAKLGTPIPNTAAPLTIGGINDGGWLRQMLFGAVDEIRLYNRVLSSEEVKATYVPVSATHDMPEDRRYLLWDSSKPVPRAAEATLLEDVEFIVVKAREPEMDGYNWLHGAAIVRHKGALYVSFGHNKGSENTATEEARGRKSTDGGKTWGPVFTIDVGNEPNLAVSHGVFLSHQGQLWAFHGSFYNRMQQLHTRAYVLNEDTDCWEFQGIVAEDGFWPTQEPLRMNNGNWIMAGICVGNGYGGSDDPAAVAISHGDDLTHWDVVRVPKPKDMEMWGESTVIVERGIGFQPAGSDQGNVGARHIPPITCIARYRKPIALASASEDSGRTWPEIRESNLPMAASKPYAGILSTGQRYLICTTTADSGNRRSPLTIAVSRPGERVFSKIYRIRDAAMSEQQSHVSQQHGPRIESHPQCRLSYPYAAEYDGKLYVVYSNDGSRGGNRNSCELAIIPVEKLRAE